jgi:demethoxyubiquinone hydroxylase (CLK1/Coq7/Cat5 family)
MCDFGSWECTEKNADGFSNILTNIAVSIFRVNDCGEVLAPLIYLSQWAVSWR